MGEVPLRVEWKSSTSATGVEYAVKWRALKMLTSSADSLDTVLPPRSGLMLASAKDQARHSWTKLHVEEMNQESTSVITVDGLIIPVNIMQI